MDIYTLQDERTSMETNWSSIDATKVILAPYLTILRSESSSRFEIGLSESANSNSSPAAPAIKLDL
jgi:hypothetical protein